MERSGSEGGSFILVGRPIVRLVVDYVLGHKNDLLFMGGGYVVL